MLRQLREDTSEMTAETDTNEGLSHVDIQICVTSENMAPALHGVDVTQGAVPPPADNEASSQTPAEEVFPQKEETKPLKTPEPVDGASSFLIQEGSVLVSDDLTASMGQEADSQATREDATVIHRDKEASYPLSLSPCAQPDSVPSSLGRRQTGSSQSSALSGVSGSSAPSPVYRDSGSDTEGFLSAEPGDDCVFRKGDDPVTGGDSTSEVSISCSSTDDTASVGLSSSSPESCLERGQALGSSWSPEEVNRPGGAATAAPSVGGETEEEAKDRLTEVPRRSALLRSSIRSVSPLRRHSWGPGKNSGGRAEMNQRSYSLEGLSRDREGLRSPSSRMPFIREPANVVRQESEERGSLVSLTEEQEEFGEGGAADEKKSRRYRPLRHSCPPMTLPLTKSVSMLAISQRDIDGTRSFSSTSGSLAYSISEEEPGPLRSDTEGKSGTKVSRTFSYLKNKMYKKTREKEREKKAEKDRENKDKDKKTVNGHLFTAVCSVQANHCSQCNKVLHTKDVFQCTYCNASVHKGCRDSLPICTKAKTKFSKHQFAVPDSSSYPVVTMRNKSSGTRERPWSAILSPEDHSSLGIPSSRRHTSIIALHGNNLSKSLSISNIAGPVFDDISIKGLRYLSQSTDSLNRTNQVTESMESLTDEGTEMMDGQLMGEFEAEVKELEADSWSFTVDQKYLGQLEKDLVKKQDVIYELMQTEMHHVRTLRIMSEVYSKGLQKEVQLEGQTVERLFPALDDLLELHTQHLLRLLERKRESQQEGSDEGFVINRIGDILVSQFSGSSAESMKRIYGKFCSRHNEAVNFYKELLTKDKRFQAFIKRKMSSSIVRRLGIPECILLVTQRITKYPVLIQRMLQHTKEDEEDFEDLAEAVRLVKETIATVDSKVNEHEKKRRLNEVYSRTDSKSIMRMKSGQMFAREDLLRGRRLLHDGALQLKNAQGRLKDVLALLLSDVFVFLQEKDQKFVFASLDQRSTVLSLHKLIVREVANEERGLFLITAGIEKPEMVEVLASSKDERNTWMQLIEDAMNSIEKDEDEGIPSETEEDKRQLESKAREMRELLRQKDAQIMALLEEKVKVFKEMCECGGPCEEQTCAEKALFRAGSGQVLPRGEPIMKDALLEVETLQALVNGSLGGAMAVGQQVAGTQEGGEAGGEEGAAGGGWVGPVCLPRRAETFGGFDSHQMKNCKSGDKDEAEDTAADLRRTESDSVLKKQVLHRVSHLHDLLSTLQAVVVQQDSFIEDQRQTLCERSSSISSSASSSRLSSRPNSLIEQEKQRSLEKQRQELASLQRQQAAHADERRRREKEWELREQQLTDREVLLHMQEEETERKRKELEEESQELQSRKEEYQRDLERLRDAQRKLERDRETLQRDMERTEQHSLAERRMERTLSSASDDSQFPGSSASLERDPAERTSSLGKDSVSRSKPRGKSLNPFSSSSTSDSRNQIPGRLLQLAKNKDKDKKEKKKKKGKGGSAQTAEPQQHFAETPLDGEIFFC
ncbi:A-kinase anchor protein 13 isoform X2 [Lampris incognitus]|uniref:A-kinase anchor protein 13 isoform X2 n=1 Tax=Lampris incognitus TaxID=2546036 RepID=UPI0024B57E66|nr:A-kinase anchor protein 13 isoform X2 [Lampris incognitus]